MCGWMWMGGCVGVVLSFFFVDISEAEDELSVIVELMNDLGVEVKTQVFFPFYCLSFSFSFSISFSYLSTLFFTLFVTLSREKKWR